MEKVFFRFANTKVILSVHLSRAAAADFQPVIRTASSAAPLSWCVEQLCCFPSGRFGVLLFSLGTYPACSKRVASLHWGGGGED